MHDVQQVWSSVVTVVIAEANQLNCQLVESAFRSKRTHVAVVASAIDSRQTLALLKEREPDVAIISAQLESGPLDGYHILRELHSLQSKTRSILLLGSRERELVIDAFRCGARGVVFRDEPLETLAKCIHAVHRGQVWANSQHLGYLLDVLSQMPMRLHDAHGMDLLSKREGDVVRLVSEGLTNRGISAQLGLSEHTVRNYLFKIFDKLGVSTRVELVLYCFQERQSRMMSARPGGPEGKNGANGNGGS
jgi:DNA-binding NarL/FixJ family response regulator